MLNLAGLTPVGVRMSPEGPRLQWRSQDRMFETDFERFRPVQIIKEPGSDDIRVAWRDFYDLPLNDPFFHIAQDACAEMKECAALFRTDLDVVDSVAAQADNIPFAGAIFHMARTGSTLVHRVFSATGKVASLSEVPMVNQALSRARRLPESQRARALRGVVGAYQRPRRPNEQHLVIKMQDAMPAKQLPVFRAAFPDTPWIFIYRDPVEVMVSLQRKPTGTLQQWYRNRAHTARNLGMPVLNDSALWPEDFMAHTLRRICASAIEAAKATPRGKFIAVSYKRLPDAIWETIGPHFGIKFTDKDRDEMRAASRYSSKTTDSVEFKPDSEKKREEAGPRLLGLAERLVAPMIRELESLPQG
jgi:hypothetical protein